MEGQVSRSASEDRAEEAERNRRRLTPGAFYVPAEEARLWTVAFGPGDGPAFVAVGGWIGSWELWAGPFGELSARWRVVGFDHRGTGATVSSAASISHERLVDDIFVVLDAHGIDRCVLAGESAGAGVVISAAARHPERVAGLVLVDGFIPTGRRRDDDPFPLSLRSDFAGTIERFVDACLPGPDADALRHWGRLILNRSTPEHAIALYCAAVDPRDDLPHVRAPALVIHCDGDRIAPLDDGRALAAGLPNATLRVLTGSEHVPTMTRPGEIAALIEEWQARILG
jgi:pimeloyl-ACP methyl ester carboxylesterase